MINPKMNDAINAQINAEYYSAYLYLSMSAWLSGENLNGFATWMKAQCQEELFHGSKMYDYLIERGGTVTLDVIEKPQTSWSSVEDVTAGVVAHELKVTGAINDLVDLAIAERDHAANIFLQWFVEEQVEEEASVSDVYEKVKRVMNDSAALYSLDVELGKRVFVQPVK
ncbi:MAG: ferritin [Desulfotalea sp.]